MATEVLNKKAEKKKSFKTIGIIVAALMIVVIIGIAIINILVSPVSDTSDKAVPVGGMLVSDEIEYKSKASEGMEKNLIIKILQLVWKSCDASDKKVHEKQVPPEVSMERDVTYSNDNNPYHMFDVFQPNFSSGPMPVIIDIHGGGWMYATKDLNEYYCRELASKGYIVFSISYRLAPDVTVPEQIQDVYNAINYIHAHISAYNTNGQVIVTGDSAGGMLALYYSMIEQSEELQKKFDVEKPFGHTDALILTSPVAYMKNAGFMSVYTKTLWGTDYKKSELYNYMNLDEIIDFADKLPPAYFITSSGDNLANSQTHKAYELFKEKGAKCEIADFGEYDGEKLPHVFSVLDPFCDAGQDAIYGALNFCNKNMEAPAN